MGIPDELDKELLPLRDELDAKICYDEFNGECYLHKKELVVICNMPDDSGIWVENEEDKKFVCVKDLYVTFQKLKLINSMRRK